MTRIDTRDALATGGSVFSLTSLATTKLTALTTDTFAGEPADSEPVRTLPVSPTLAPVTGQPVDNPAGTGLPRDPLPTIPGFESDIARRLGEILDEQYRAHGEEVTEQQAALIRGFWSVMVRGVRVVARAVKGGGKRLPPEKLAPLMKHLDDAARDVYAAEGLIAHIQGKSWFGNAKQVALYIAAALGALALGAEYLRSQGVNVPNPVALLWEEAIEEPAEEIWDKLVWVGLALGALYIIVRYWR